MAAVLGDVIYVFLLSLMPFFEGRYALLVGASMGIDLKTSFFIASVGTVSIGILLSMIIPFIDSFFLKTRIEFARKIYTNIVLRVRRKFESYSKYGLIGLLLFVAVPLPGTGVWSGGLAAFLFGIKRRHTIIGLSMGAVLSNIITSLSYYGFIKLF